MTTLMPLLPSLVGFWRRTLSQTLPTRSDDRRDCPVSGTQQGAFGRSSTAAPVLQKCPLPAPLQSYCHSVGWANNPTCSDCNAGDHTVAHLFSCPTQITDLVIWENSIIIQILKQGSQETTAAPSLCSAWQ